MIIRAGDDILAVDLRRPPAQRRHPILNRCNRELLREPEFGERFNVFRFQRIDFQLPIAKFV